MSTLSQKTATVAEKCENEKGDCGRKRRLSPTTATATSDAILLISKAIMYDLDELCIYEWSNGASFFT